MKKLAITLTVLALLALPLVAAGKGTAQKSTVQETDMNAQTQTEAKRLGGLTPEAALEFLKSTPDVVIVEVNTDYWKLKTGFIGALHIPHDQMASRYNEIPRGRPVILHCGAGVVSVPAYETLCEKRPDIPVLGYIAGHPPVAEYNKWYKEHHK